MTTRELADWFGSFAPDGRPRVDRLRERRASGPGHCAARPAWLLHRRQRLRGQGGLGEVPFRSVPYAEDHQLALDMLRAGYAKVYVPGAAVLHSHDYAPRRALPPRLRRVARPARGLRLHRAAAGRHAARQGAGPCARRPALDARERRQPRRVAALAPRAVVHHTFKTAGALAGSRADRFGPGLRRAPVARGPGRLRPRPGKDPLARELRPPADDLAAHRRSPTATWA